MSWKCCKVHQPQVGLLCSFFFFTNFVYSLSVSSIAIILCLYLRGLEFSISIINPGIPLFSASNFDKQIPLLQ